MFVLYIYIIIYICHNLTSPHPTFLESSEMINECVVFSLRKRMKNWIQYDSVVRKSSQVCWPEASWWECIPIDLCLLVCLCHVCLSQIWHRMTHQFTIPHLTASVLPNPQPSLWHPLAIQQPFKPSTGQCQRQRLVPSMDNTLVGKQLQA